MFFLLDINATGLNTILTAISIICTLISGHCTFRAKKIKRQVFAKLNTYDLAIYSRELHKLNMEVSSKIRTPNSNKAGSNNKKLAELNKILVDFNIMEKALPEEYQKGIRNNVDYVLEHFMKINEGTAQEDEINRWKKRLQDIDKKLIEITDKMIKE